jgi:hypothetical protein
MPQKELAESDCQVGEVSWKIGRYSSFNVGSLIEPDKRGLRSCTDLKSRQDWSPVRKHTNRVIRKGCILDLRKNAHLTVHPTLVSLITGLAWTEPHRSQSPHGFFPQEIDQMEAGPYSESNFLSLI